MHQGVGQAEQCSTKSRRSESLKLDCQYIWNNACWKHTLCQNRAENKLVSCCSLWQKPMWHEPCTNTLCAVQAAQNLQVPHDEMANFVTITLNGNDWWRRNSEFRKGRSANALRLYTLSDCCCTHTYIHTHRLCHTLNRPCHEMLKYKLADH